MEGFSRKRAVSVVRSHVGRSDGQRLLHVLLPVDGMGSQMKRPGGDAKRCERFGGLPPAT
jgi:hypothetical protein